MSSPGGHPCNRAHPLRVVDGTHRQDRSWVPDRVVPHSRGHRFREAGGHSFLSYISLPHISPVSDPQPVGWFGCLSIPFFTLVFACFEHHRSLFP